MTFVVQKYERNASKGEFYMSNKEEVKKIDKKIDRVTEGLRYKASSKVQIVLLILFFSVISWVLYKPVISFRTDDKYPEIISLTPQKILNLGGSPTFVDVGMHIRDVPKFDVLNGIAIADLTAWFLFDPRLVSLDRIGQFDFDRSKIISKSKPSTRIEGSKLLARYDMRIQFSLDLNYKSFPLEDHRVSFILTNYHLSPSEVIFKSSRGTFVLNNEIRIPGWQCVDKSVKTGYLRDTLDPYRQEEQILYSRTIFSLDFIRVGFRHIMVILMPLLLIFLISLLTLTLNPYGIYGGSIFPIGVASVTAIIAHQIVIERMSPATGYLMISNHIFLLMLGSCCVVLMVNIFGKKIRGYYKDIIAFLLYFVIALEFILLIKPFS